MLLVSPGLPDGGTERNEIFLRRMARRSPRNGAAHIAAKRAMYKCALHVVPGLQHPSGANQFRRVSTFQMRGTVFPAAEKFPRETRGARSSGRETTLYAFLLVFIIRFSWLAGTVGMWRTRRVIQAPVVNGGKPAGFSPFSISRVISTVQFFHSSILRLSCGRRNAEALRRSLVVRW